MRSFLVAGVVVILPMAALAEPEVVEVADGVLTYEMFEASVPHADLSTCPTSLAGDDRFCRLTLSDGYLTVWAFRNEGRQELLAMLTHDTEDEGLFGFQSHSRSP